MLNVKCVRKYFYLSSKEIGTITGKYVNNFGVAWDLPIYAIRLMQQCIGRKLFYGITKTRGFHYVVQDLKSNTHQ